MMNDTGRPPRPDHHADRYQAKIAEILWLHGGFSDSSVDDVSAEIVDEARHEAAGIMTQAVKDNMAPFQPQPELVNIIVRLMKDRERSAKQEHEDLSSYVRHLNVRLGALAIFLTTVIILSNILACIFLS